MGGDAAGDPALLDRLRREITAQGPISFARFMEIALYDPDHGYYARGPERLGTEGDFYTASDCGRQLGRCLARQLIGIDAAIGPLDPFHYVEWGAGRGLLARDVVDALRVLDPGLSRRLRCVLVDRSAAMREAASGRVPEAEVLAPEQLAGPYDGCAVAVELFDALPVHRVRREGERLVEIAVDVDDSGRPVERGRPPEAAIERLADRYDVAPLDGMAAEIAPQAPGMLDRMAQAMRRGVLIVLDYGDRATGLYGPGRPTGTLLAYRRHATSDRYLERIGRQDLTAHVNFSALEDRARESGLDVLALTTQDRFLVANGILEVFEPPPPAERNAPSHVKARLQALQLIHPTGMGRAFRVLALSKGCAPAPRLDGLDDPFAS